MVDSFTCPDCGLTSYNPNDVANGYCGHCHKYLKPGGSVEGITWRYCITREVIDGEDHFTVREVYTSKDGKLSWTEEAIAPRGGTWRDCADDIGLMTRAVNGRILDLSLDPPQLVHPKDLLGITEGD